MFEIPKQNIVQILGPNRSILIATENIEYFLQAIERNQRLNGTECRCHAIQNIALVMTYFDVLRVRRYQDVSRVVKFMEITGFTKLWRERYQFYLEASFKGDNDKQSFVNKIDYDDLVSLFIFCTILIEGASLIFLVEIGTPRRENIMRFCKRGPK